MTGGTVSRTTEILEDKKWTVLPHGDLPGPGILYGLKLATVYNKVFSFGKFSHLFYVFFYDFLYKVVMKEMENYMNPSHQSSNSILLKGNGTIHPII